MLRNTILLILLFCSYSILSQSISYSVGFGLPRSLETGFQSNISESYKKGQEFSFGIGFTNTGTIADLTEIRFSTYESTLQNSLGGFAGTMATDLSIRKYI